MDYLARSVTGEEVECEHREREAGEGGDALAEIAKACRPDLGVSFGSALWNPHLSRGSFALLRSISPPLP
jgi:hypothetical protein